MISGLLGKDGDCGTEALPKRADAGIDDACLLTEIGFPRSVLLY